MGRESLFQFRDPQAVRVLRDVALREFLNIGRFLALLGLFTFLVAWAHLVWRHT